MKNADITITANIEKEIKSLSHRKIDLSDQDAPEITNWEKVSISKFYRPVKKQITIRIDADVLHWFKHTTGKYQSLMNQACREYMEHHSHSRKKSSAKIK